MRTPLLCLILVVACGGSGRTNSDANSDPDAVGGDAATDGPDNPGELCGGFVPRSCAADEYCDFPDNSCGVADATGNCRKRPQACPAIVEAGSRGTSVVGSLVGRPVCACDGMVHSSDCIAFSAGVDLNASGGCTLPAGNFACGYAVCALLNQYCRHEVKPSGEDLYTCIALPSTCTTGAASCTCLRGQPCADRCTGDAKVGLTLTCQ